MFRKVTCTLQILRIYSIARFQENSTRGIQIRASHVKYPPIKIVCYRRPPLIGQVFQLYLVLHNVVTYLTLKVRLCS